MTEGAGLSVERLAEKAALSRGWTGLVALHGRYRLAWQRGYAAGYLGRERLNPYRVGWHQFHDVWERGWQIGYEDQR